MKNLMLTVPILLIAGTILTNCQSSAKDDSNAKFKLQEMNSYLAEHRNDSAKVLHDTTTYQRFMNESENKINKYEQEIADLKVKIAKLKKADKEKYDNKLAQLEQKRVLLKNKIVDFKDTQHDSWNEKQVEFKKDMDDLGSAISNFFVKDE